MPTPEELARQNIDALLEQCGWIIQNYKQLDRANLGRQTMAAVTDAKQRPGFQFQQFATPDGRKFTER